MAIDRPREKQMSTNEVIERAASVVDLAERSARLFGERPITSNEMAKCFAEVAKQIRLLTFY